MKETFKIYKGSVYFTKGGEYHRDCGPSLMWDTGSVFFYKEGKYHRDCGPSNVWNTGSMYFYKEGRYSRDCGPHVIGWNGEKTFHSSIPESVIPLLILEWEKKYERDF